MKRLFIAGFRRGFQTLSPLIILLKLALVLLMLNGFGKFAIVLLLVWSGIYFPLVVGRRLIALGVIKKSQIW